jgi:flagellar protein FlaG
MIVNVNNVVSPIDATKAVSAPAEGASALGDGGNPSPAGGNDAPAPVALDFERSVQALAEFISNNARGLLFRVDDASGRTVVTVVNPNNGEVIRQIPSEEVLHLARALRQDGTVHLLDERA